MTEPYATPGAPAHPRPPRPAEGRARWPWAGVAAGVLGIAATLISDVHPVVEKGEGYTSEYLDEVPRMMAHISIVTGFATVALLLVLAAAWRRRVEPRLPGSTAAHLVPHALTASAGALTLGYAWKGSLALYLPGGVEAGGFDEAALYTMFVLNDFGSFIGWLGVIVAAGAIAWMGLRERTVSRWIGAISLLPVLIVAGAVGSTGLPGFQGVIGPVWLTAASLGLAFGRSTIVRD
ncbi:hypothetical protein [Actinocorallia populi]|uniref:hypothetical protein n=1 Tax=Actinocorallia populi TaxID=2079200 RepID=UPI000D087C31|nr:hypothetical protein [Actinocorallia populi]